MSFYPNPKIGLGSSAFARHYLRNRFFFLFLRLLRCFSSPGCSHDNYIFIIRYHFITSGGFPHSDISGSMLTYSSPKHFVVCHVLLHLLMPRHSPYALSYLITIFVILIWWDFTTLKSYRYIYARFVNISHIIQFSKNYFSWKNNVLSKLSKTFIKNIALPFFRFSFSIERRWSIPTFS